MITLSPTQINMFLRCQYQWYLRYVEGIKIPPKPEMVVGTAFHRAMEENFKHKIEKQTDLPVSDVLDVFDYEFNQKIEEVEEKDDKTIGDLKDSGYSITKEYYTKKAINVLPLEVESYIEHQVSSDIKLQGYADIITEDLTVIDLKTVKRKPSDEVDLAYQLQLETYALSGDILKAEIHYAVQTKKPEIITISHNLPKEPRITKIALQVSNAIKTGIFLPNGLGHNWACSYCGYRQKGLCPYNK